MIDINLTLVTSVPGAGLCEQKGRDLPKCALSHLSRRKLCNSAGRASYSDDHCDDDLCTNLDLELQETPVRALGDTQCAKSPNFNVGVSRGILTELARGPKSLGQS